MSDQVAETDDERERLAREDEQREVRAQNDEVAESEVPESSGASTQAPDLVEPPVPGAAADPEAEARERAAQADDEEPSDIVDHVDYDAVPAREHISHGDAGADLVDEPGEPDVPAQTEYIPVAPAPPLAPEASDAMFVEPPVEPRVRHNRLFGVGIVLLSTIFFAALYAGLAALLIGFRLPPREFLAGFELFLVRPAFVVPIVAYAVFGVLSALLVNRARWWAYTLMSLIVGLLVYAVSVVIVLLLAGYLGDTDAGRRALLVEALTQPVLIAAGFAAREVLLWSGLGIAARGRRVVARNRADREEYERRTARSEAVWNGSGAEV